MLATCLLINNIKMRLKLALKENVVMNKQLNFPQFVLSHLVLSRQLNICKWTQGNFDLELIQLTRSMEKDMLRKLFVFYGPQVMRSS